MENCVFCKIINRKLSGFIIDEDDSVIVFLSLEHHPLIVPKRHLEDMFALDNEIAAQIAQKSIGIAKAMRVGLSCDGIYVTQTNGSCAGQDVFHYHMHLYPKWNNGESKHQNQSKEEILKKKSQKLRFARRIASQKLAERENALSLAAKLSEL